MKTLILLFIVGIVCACNNRLPEDDDYTWAGQPKPKDTLLRYYIGNFYRIRMDTSNGYFNAHYKRLFDSLRKAPQKKVKPK